MAKQQPIEIFMPPNILKAKGAGGGGLDHAAIQRAESAVEDLRDEFAVWILNDVKQLLDARDIYEKQVDVANLSNLYRTAHDLKGQASTFDFPLVARVASSLCKLTDDSKLFGELPLTLIVRRRSPFSAKFWIWRRKIWS